MSQVISYTPCLYTGIYPRCPKAKGICPLGNKAKQVKDKSGLIEMCITQPIMD